MNDTDAQSLPSEIYHVVVAPPLLVTAELAASRGDPDLCNDMASMLALRTLIQDLATCYSRDHSEEDTKEALASASASACVMVLQRAELAPEQLSDCLWALGAAEKQLRDADVIGPERELTERAWFYLGKQDHDRAREVLTSAARRLVREIDQWEQARA